jgi:DNA polymerase-3 subunit gamma/tau
MFFKVILHLIQTFFTWLTSRNCPAGEHFFKLDQPYRNQYDSKSAICNDSLSYAIDSILPGQICLFRLPGRIRDATLTLPMIEALYRKWRPARFDDVIGQEHVTRTLRNSVAAGRVGHAYLFCGPRGTGKTTLARLLAKAVNCLHEEPTERPCDNCHACRAINEGRFLDLIEIDAASNTGVDDIRDLRDKINFSPAEGRYKVYIIDEVHMLSISAFNALLKTLEEQPPHAKFVLATTEAHKVPMTIKSRCQQFNFRLLTMAEITGRLSWLAAKEDLTIAPAALRLIARHGNGSLRDAESLLDQLVTIPGDEITLERAQMVLGTAADEMVYDLTDAWLNGNGPAGLALIQKALSTGVDARQFCRQMVDYLRAVLLLHAAGADLPLDLTGEQKELMLAQSGRADREQLIAAIKAFNEAALTPAANWQPQLPLELAFIALLPEETADRRPQTAVAGRSRSQRDEPTTAGEPQTAAASRSRSQRDELTADRRPQTEDRPETGDRRPEQAVTTADDRRRTAEEIDGPPSPQDESTADDGPQAADTPAPLTTAPVPEEKPARQPQTSHPQLEDYRANWSDMVERVAEQDRSLTPMLAMCRPIAIEGNTLILGFEFDVLRGKFEERTGAVHMVADTFSTMMNHKCHVRCVVTGQYRPPAGSNPVPNRPETPAANQPGDDESIREQFYALAAELGGTVRET